MSMQKNICIESFERGIVRHCAPTLAGLKPAGLFTYHGCACKGSACANRYTLGDAISACNAKLAQNGITVTSLGNTSNGGTLIFVYRPTLLENALHDSRSEHYLKQAGYDLSTLEFAIGGLRERLVNLGNQGFPHEIGIFLGYPFEDVTGFIEGGIGNATCTGCWCVYSNEEEARRCFCQYSMCTKLCTRMFDNGVSIAQLPVMAHSCVPSRAA